MQGLENLQTKIVSLQKELEKTQRELQTANTRIQDANTRIQDDADEVRHIRVERIAVQTEMKMVKHFMDEMGRAVLLSEQADAASGSGRTTDPNAQLDPFYKVGSNRVGQFYIAYLACKNRSGNNLDLVRTVGRSCFSNCKVELYLASTIFRLP